MKVSLVTALTDPGREAALVAAFSGPGSGVEVVRRCVDVADLLATAATGRARAAVVSADLRRLDRDALVRLRSSRVAVVGLVPRDDEAGERRLRQLGVAVVPLDAQPAEVVVALVGAVTALAEATPLTASSLADPRAALPDPGVDEPPVAGAPEPGSGRVVAVWGPTGAPGRTTVAVTLADEVARLGTETLLVDADTYGGVVAQVLGLLEEAAGVAAACRASAAGTLDVPALAALCRAVGPRLRVLTGIGRADRWPEVRPAAVPDVLDLARSLVAVTVVDCGFGLEADEELSFDTAAPRRNGATLAVLESADEVLAVGAADPVGLQRLVRGLDELREAVPGVEPRVLLTRVRRSVVGGRDPSHELPAALERFAGVRDVVLVPDDRDACDRALAAGRTLGEAAAGSPARAALQGVAAALVGAPPPRAPHRRLLARR